MKNNSNVDDGSIINDLCLFKYKFKTVYKIILKKVIINLLFMCRLAVDLGIRIIIFNLFDKG